VSSKGLSYVGKLTDPVMAGSWKLQGWEVSKDCHAGISAYYMLCILLPSTYALISKFTSPPISPRNSKYSLFKYVVFLRKCTVKQQCN
jgi:hypothetical protein